MPGKTSSLRDYLQLCRLPNVFTALADVTMGFLFAHARFQAWEAYLCLAAAAVSLYTAGMVLNDVWDIEQDRRERPSRPLASGRIALSSGRRIGFGLLVGGIVFGWAAGYVLPVDLDGAWRSGLVAMLLAALIVLYDARLKRTPLGPLAMGGCRLLNVLLGMSCATMPVARPLVAGYDAPQLLVAGGIGLYIVGVTWFARREASGSNRWQLAAATAVIAGGIVLLGTVHQALPANRVANLPNETTWWLLLGLLGFVIVRRCLTAVLTPSPHRVQLAVTNAIWSLIVLDAAVVLLVCHVGWSLAIITLLVPTMLLGRWIKST